MMAMLERRRQAVEAIATRNAAATSKTCCTVLSWCWFHSVGDCCGVSCSGFTNPHAISRAGRSSRAMEGEANGEADDGGRRDTYPLPSTLRLSSSDAGSESDDDDLVRPLG